MEPIATARSAREAKALIDSLPQGQVLDVREEAEYITGHLADAMLLPVDEIDAASAALLLPDKDQPLLVYCRSGKRSRQAAEKLMALGYRQLYDLGGLAGWPYALE